MPNDIEDQDIESFWGDLRPKREATPEFESVELVVTPTVVKIDSPELNVMLGHVFSSVVVGENNQTMTFHSQDGTRFEFYHGQDCCESVQVEDVVGDLADLVGCPLVEADEISSEGYPNPEDGDVVQWTFYRFSTVRGTVTVRWLGDSNGYYSMSVDFKVIPK
jgi:hypothetical protein